MSSIEQLCGGCPVLDRATCRSLNAERRRRLLAIVVEEARGEWELCGAGREPDAREVQRRVIYRLKHHDCGFSWGVVWAIGRWVLPVLIRWVLDRLEETA